MNRSRKGRPGRVAVVLLTFCVTGVAQIFTQSTATASPVSVWSVPTVPGPVQTVHGYATEYVRKNLDAVPVGANDFGCRPTEAHPRPVVLVHGTDSSAYSDYAALSPMLADAGFCVFALNFGRDPARQTYGTEDMAISGVQVATFVEQVRTATGAEKVDIVGYSQGATVSRYFINRLGGAQYVSNWVGMASPSYGGVFYGLGPAAQAVPGAVDMLTPTLTTAVVQQMQGSNFLTALNSGGDTVAGVKYTTVSSNVDEMIQPFTNMALHGPNATNLVLQDLCPINMSGHFQLAYDPYALQLVVNALDPEAAKQPQCVAVPLGTGIPEVVGAAHS